MLEARGRLLTHHTRNKFQRARSLMACRCFVWTLHSTVPNLNDKSASERCKAPEEKISKWKVTTLSSVYAPLLSNPPWFMLWTKWANNLHFTMKLYLYSETCCKDLHDRFTQHLKKISWKKFEPCLHRIKQNHYGHSEMKIAPYFPPKLKPKE